MVSVTFRSYHSVLISDQTILVHLLLCLKKNFKHAVEHYLSIISSTSDKQINYAFVCTCFILMHLTYTLCLKNIPDIFSCNSRKHCRIFIMFGTHVTEKVSNQYLYSFPPHLTSASALPEIMQQFRNSIISLKCCITCFASFKQSPLDFFKLVDS